MSAAMAPHRRCEQSPQARPVKWPPAMSALGQKQTSRLAQGMSALPLNADIARRDPNHRRRIRASPMEYRDRSPKLDVSLSPSPDKFVEEAVFRCVALVHSALHDDGKKIDCADEDDIDSEPLD